MKNRVEIDCPKAWDTYNDKGVLFQRISFGKPVIIEGKFSVALNSKAMWIEWIVEVTAGKVTFESIPVTPEILGGILPASQKVVDDSKGKILFVVQKPIQPVRDTKPSHP